MTLAQDPDELFDVVDALGNATGVVKRRGDVHRDGDWHRAIHIWVVGEDPAGPFIICQRRSFQKDTWPGELDVTVGGHLGAGESLEDAFREVEEEIGVSVEPSQLLWVGRRLAIGEEPGIHIDHEIQEVYFLRDERPLTDFRPNPHKLEGLIKLRLDPLLELLHGDRDSIDAAQRSANSEELSKLSLTLDSFKLTYDRYFHRVAIAARNHLRGDAYVAV